ncbi:MAG: hypothetical protein BKP49_01005 [Treponema sp. CETP13]|nr:MAG: hypothetical protein BKP49_01005 [Treponema sp. CETP13]
MTTHDSSLFSYINGSSPVHKLPAEIKIFLILICPPLLFLTNLQVCLIFMLVISLSSRMCGISFYMQLRDIKPIIIYSFFLIIIGFFSSLYTYFFVKQPFLINTPSTITETLLFLCKPKRQTQLLILHLICTMQFTSFFFKTTTSLHLKEALENIESKITLGKSSGFFAQTFSLFLTFIPTVFRVWNQINLAWLARAGKNNISKYVTLLPIFISVSLQKAHHTFLALENRK